VSDFSGGGIQWAIKGVTSSVERLSSRRTTFAVDQRHENDDRWTELGLFASRFLAQEALEAHAAESGKEPGTFRVRKVKKKRRVGSVLR
jgi:hypothetical protein